MNWFRKLFCRKKPAPLPIGAPLFEDNFLSLDTTKWTVSTWQAPGTSATNKGSFSKDHVFIKDGMLCLKLTQRNLPDGTTVSIGGEIALNQQFGYGTYTWVVRASSTAAASGDVGIPTSGSITGCFIYRTGALTEIDVEVEGNERSLLTQFTSWIGESKPNQTTTATPPGSGTFPHEEFFTYSYRWNPGKIEFFRDGVLVATHTGVVPSMAATPMINHWGTNNANWGGLATPNVDRYMYVKKFSFTPM